MTRTPEHRVHQEGLNSEATAQTTQADHHDIVSLTGNCADSGVRVPCLSPGCPLPSGELRTDTARRCVRLINDAAASRPGWVQSLAESWLSECCYSRTPRDRTLGLCSAETQALVGSLQNRSWLLGRNIVRAIGLSTANGLTAFIYS